MKKSPLPLSETDKRILRTLQSDSSISSRDLAEQLNLSQSTLWRRMSELEATKVITGRVALLDADLVGMPVSVFISITMKSHEPDIRKAFEAFIQTVPEVMECFSVTGAHDYTLIVRTASVASFERLLMDRILSHPSVASASSNIALRQQKYSTALPI